MALVWLVCSRVTQCGKEIIEAISEFIKLFISICADKNYGMVVHILNSAIDMLKIYSMALASLAHEMKVGAFTLDSHFV